MMFFYFLPTSSSEEPSKYSLLDNGITDAHIIEFTLDVYDSDDWTADHLVKKTITIYPLNEDASSVKIENRQAIEGEVVVVDNKNIRFVIEKNYVDSIWGYTLSCYIENKTSKELTFSINDVSVNDYMIDPFWSESIMGGKKAISKISFDESDLKKNGINTVTKIDFKLDVYDSNDWFADKLYSKKHNYTPQ